MNLNRRMMSQNCRHNWRNWPAGIMSSHSYCRWHFRQRIANAILKTRISWTPNMRGTLCSSRMPTWNSLFMILASVSHKMKKTTFPITKDHWWTIRVWSRGIRSSNACPSIKKCSNLIFPCLRRIGQNSCLHGDCNCLSTRNRVPLHSLRIRRHSASRKPWCQSLAQRVSDNCPRAEDSNQWPALKRPTLPSKILKTCCM